MDIDINLLPEEIRPKPLLNARMLLLLVVVGVLGFGCYYFYDLKAGTEADAAVAESRIEAVEDEASDLANNAEAKEIVAGISEAKATLAELEAATSDYVVFKDSRIGWGEVVDRVAISRSWRVVAMWWKSVVWHRATNGPLPTLRRWSWTTALITFTPVSGKGRSAGSCCRSMS
jgi:hypothetical protein